MVITETILNTTLYNFKKEIKEIFNKLRERINKLEVTVKVIKKKK